MEYCKKNNIIYFDTTNECCNIEKESTTVMNEYIGKDNHYKGAEFESIFIKELDEDKNYGNMTYFTFLNKLMTNIN